MNFKELIKNNSPVIVPVMDIGLAERSYHLFDFSSGNTKLNELDLNDEHAFTDFVFNQIKQKGVRFGIGKYDEDRVFYKRSPVFSSGDRSIHLGIDIWSQAGDPVFSALEGVIHSFQNNVSHGDYGPTIITEHTLGTVTFYLLYGHLNTKCLSNLTVGQKIRAGDKIALLGNYEENVHWPPHLHFQVITDMEGMSGDFPGVCAKKDREHYLSICPDPNILLGIKGL